MDFVNRIKEKYKVKQMNDVDGVYYLKNEDYYIQFIFPHSGTMYQYCLRADFPETFDRWRVCLFEEDFVEEEFEEILVKLDHFIKDKEKIVRQELEETEE